MSNGRIECFINSGIPRTICLTINFHQHISAASRGFTTGFSLLTITAIAWKTFLLLPMITQELKYIKIFLQAATCRFQLMYSDLITTKNSVNQIIDLSSNTYPAIIDVDNDGDLDLLNWTRGQSRSVEYNKNISEENVKRIRADRDAGIVLLDGGQAFGDGAFGRSGPIPSPP